MKLYWRALLIAVCLSGATRATARSWPETGGWTIVELDDSCTMTMEYDGKGDTELFLLLYVDGGVQLGLANSLWTIKDGATFEPRILLTGSEYSGAKAVGLRIGYKPGFTFKGNSAFLSDFAAGSSIHIYNGETVVDQLRLTGSAAALGILKRCVAHVSSLKQAERREKEKWAHIPDDPFAGSPSAASNAEAKAKGNPGSWLTNADYPHSAIRAKESGTTGYKLETGTDGRVTNCTISLSSGSRTLDDTACRLLTRRARFTPAKDAAGNPISDTYSSRFRWVLPDE